MIMTDSRGFCPGDNKNWVSLFKKENPQYNINSYTYEGGRVTTIFELLKKLQKEEKCYDILVIQAGVHEYVQNWPKRIFKNKLEHLDPNYCNNLTKVKENAFTYRNDSLIRTILQKFIQYAKNVLFIGMHFRGPATEKRSVIMNDVFDIDEIDFFNLPFQNSWAGKYCYDSTHYSEAGTIFISNYVERYSKRINKTISDILKSNR